MRSILGLVGLAAAAMLPHAQGDKVQVDPRPAPRFSAAKLRKIMAAGGRAPWRGSPYVTRGNRAQRARQLGGMMMLRG